MHTIQAGERIALKNVLFATDFSANSKSALPYAVAVAQRYGAKLLAVHVKPTEAEIFFASPETWPAVVDEENKWVQDSLSDLEKQIGEVPHEIVTPRGRVADVLTEIIKDRDIDLLVLGTHGRTGLGKLFLGSVAEETFRRAACPVLSIGPNVSTKLEGEIQFQRILFATDFSQVSLAALPYAVSLAEEDQAQLTLLHVVEQPAAGIADLEEVKASLMLKLKELVPPEAELWCHPECEIEFGRQFAPPAQLILEVARNRSVGLIVLGARPLHGKLGLVTHLASTTSQILTQAACPVLTVRQKAA